MALQFRKGLNSERLAITPATGEPIWTTDTEKLYIGDGSTIGGIELSVDSAFISSIINTTDFNSLIDSAYVQARQLAQTPQDFEYGSLVNTPNILDSANVSSIVVGYSYVTQTAIDNSIDALINGAPGALDTLKELADALGEDSDAIAAINTTLGLKINATAFDGLFASALSTKTTTDVAEGNNLYYTSARHDSDTIAQVDASFVQALQIQQDFSYASLTGAPNVLDSADVVSVTTDTVDATFVRNLQDYSYSNLTGRPNILDSGHVTSIIDSEAVLLINSTVDATFVRNLQDYSYANITGAPTNVSSFANDAGYITAAGATDSAEVTGIINNVVDSAFVQALQTPQDFAYASLTNSPYIFDSATVAAIAAANALDSAMVQAIINGSGIDSSAIINLVDSAYVQARSPLQDFAYASLTGSPNITGIVDSAINALVDGAPSALDTLAELATQLNNDSNAIVAVVNTLALKLNIADVVPQDFTYGSLTGTPTNVSDFANDAGYITAAAATDSAEVTGIINNVVDAAFVQALSPLQDFAYASLTGAPNVLDSADVIAIHNALGGVDSAAITSMIDSNYVASRVTLAYAGGASVQDYKFIADSGQTVFNGLSYNNQFVQVHLNGALLLNTDDYILSGGNTVTLLQALDSGDQIVVSDFTSFFTNQVVDSAYIDNLVSTELSSLGSSDISTFKFIATASQTVFTGSDANSNTLDIDTSGIQVFLNGILLQLTDDYTATSNTVTLTEAALENSHLIVQSFKRYFNLTGLDSAAVIALSPPQDFAYGSLTGTPTNVSTFTNDAGYITAAAATDSAEVTGIINNVVDSAYVQALSPLQDFAYASLTGAPNVLDSANVTTIIDAAYIQSNQIVQDFAYASLTGSPNITSIVDSAINSLVDGAPGALDTLAELATQLNNDSDAIAAIVTNLALKLNIADVVPQDFAYASLTGTPTLFDGNYASLANLPNILDSADVIALSPPQDFAYASLTGTPNVLDSSNVSTLITTAVDALVAGAPAALDTLNELATALNDDSNAIAAITSTLALKLNIADVVAQDFAYTSLTGTPNILDSADVISLSPPQDFAYASLTGTPNILDSADVTAIASALGGVDSAAITSMIDSDYITSRASLAYAGSASVTDTKFIADSAQTIFTGLSFNNQFVQVHLNGALLLDTDDYVKSGNNTITVLQALEAGDQLVVSDFTSFFTNQSLENAASGSLTSYAFVADSGATTFGGMVYSPNNIQVFLNGILLGDSDYTATNGASIVLTAGVSQDDEIRVAAFNSLFTVDIAGQIDSAYINARVDALPQDFAYASLTGTPNILDSAAVTSIASALGGGVDSAAITSMIDSDYIASRAGLTFAGSASVTDTKFIADSDQTIFTGLSFNDQFVQVHLNGVLLLNTDDYVKSGNDTITTTRALEAGDQLVVSDFTSFFTNTTVTAATINGLIDSALSNVGVASITDTKFIADSAQTIFTGLSFNDQLIQVHLNGVLLIDSDDYVKSGNDTITTTYPLNAGDYLVVSDFTAFFTPPALAAAPATSIAIGTRTTAINISITNQQFTVASRTGTVSVGVS